MPDNDGYIDSRHVIDGDRKKALKKKGEIDHAERFPDQARIIESLRKRRAFGKPIDGACMAEHGQALEELKKGSRT